MKQPSGKDQHEVLRGETRWPGSNLSFDEVIDNGIGLTICQKVVANHRGVTASSSPGQGRAVILFVSN